MWDVTPFPWTGHFRIFFPTAHWMEKGSWSCPGTRTRIQEVGEIRLVSFCLFVLGLHLWYSRTTPGGAQGNISSARD